MVSSSLNVMWSSVCELQCYSGKGQVDDKSLKLQQVKFEKGIINF